jgi:hypothetical protein
MRTYKDFDELDDDDYVDDSILAQTSGVQITQDVRDFIDSLDDLARLFNKADLTTEQRREIKASLSEAAREAASEKPNKNKIAGLIAKAIQTARSSNNAVELLKLAAPYMSRAAAWLGDAATNAQPPFP